MICTQFPGVTRLPAKKLLKHTVPRVSSNRKQSILVSDFIKMYCINCIHPLGFTAVGAKSDTATAAATATATAAATATTANGNVADSGSLECRIRPDRHWRRRSHGLS